MTELVNLTRFGCSTTSSNSDCVGDHCDSLSGGLFRLSLLYWSPSTSTFPYLFLKMPYAIFAVKTSFFFVSDNLF